MLTHDLGRKIFGNPENAGNTISKQEATDLLHNWVKNERLRQHMIQVGWLMKCWAVEKENLSDNDSWQWQLAGLLHDADWDQWPEEHCKIIIAELETRNVDPGVLHAIASHGPTYFGVEPESKMDKMLYAFDELSGFLHAYSLMRPNQYAGMEVKGVLKRMKDKTFAANVNREDIKDASERCGIAVEELIQFAIDHQPQATL